MSLDRQGWNRVQSSRVTRWNADTTKRRNSEDQRNNRECHRIKRRDAEEKRCENSGQSYRCCHANGDTRQRHAHALPDDHIPHLPRLSAKRAPHAYLMGPLLNRVRGDCVNSNHRSSNATLPNPVISHVFSANGAAAASNTSSIVRILAAGKPVACNSSRWATSARRCGSVRVRIVHVGEKPPR